MTGLAARRVVNRTLAPWDRLVTDERFEEWGAIRSSGALVVVPERLCDEFRWMTDGLAQVS